jgi:hypothetical protein
MTKACGRAFRQSAQGIAVQVNEMGISDDKFIAELPKRVSLIQFECILKIRAHVYFLSFGGESGQGK